MCKKKMSPKYICVRKFSDKKRNLLDHIGKCFNFITFHQYINVSIKTIQ